MTPKEKANEIYNSLKIVDWDESKGFTTCKIETKENCKYMINEIKEHAQMIPTGYHGYKNAYEFYLEVEKEIYKI